MSDLNFSEIGKRLKKAVSYIIYLDDLEDRKEFSKKIGYNYTNLSKVFNGNPQYANLTFVKKLCEAYNGVFVESWFSTGEGGMLKSEIAKSIPDTSGIPLYRIEAAAGFGNSNFSIDGNDIEARYKIKELESSSFMLHVRGDSMNPTYCNGDVIAVQVVTDHRKIQWGKPHLISSSSDGLLVKRIYDDEESVIAVSDNPTYKPIRIDKEGINGIAIVKGCVKFEN